MLTESEQRAVLLLFVNDFVFLHVNNKNDCEVDYDGDTRVIYPADGGRVWSRSFGHVSLHLCMYRT